jgi:hypothetical protein
MVGFSAVFFLHKRPANRRVSFDDVIPMFGLSLDQYCTQSKNAGYGAQCQSMARSAKEGKRGGGGGGSHSRNNSEFPEVPKLIAQSIVELIA